jgi:hypothetical protein
MAGLVTCSAGRTAAGKLLLVPRKKVQDGKGVADSGVGTLAGWEAAGLSVAAVGKAATHGGMTPAWSRCTSPAPTPTHRRQCLRTAPRPTRAVGCKAPR